MRKHIQSGTYGISLSVYQLNDKSTMKHTENKYNKGAKDQV